MSMVYNMRVSEQTTLDMTNSLYKAEEYRIHLQNVVNARSRSDFQGLEDLKAAIEA